MSKHKKIFSIILLACLPFLSSAKIRLSQLICDHMVMQRNQPVNLWGWAKEGMTIQVMFQNQTYESIAAGTTGEWTVTLPAMPAGGPYVLTIKDEGETLTIKDVWLGDVWICSGQSNMEWMVKGSNNAAKEIATTKDQKIRHFKVPKSYSFEPEATLAGGTWEVAAPETVGDFTAVGFFFARELRKHHDVAIGLINTSWGGSRIEPWMSGEALGYESPKETMLEMKREMDAETSTMRKAMEARLGHFPTEDMGMKGQDAIWAASDWDDGDWETMKLPGLWEGQGWDKLDGVVWFRKTIHLSEAEANRGGTLHLGKIDDSDITWVNGQHVGAMESAWSSERIYPVAAEVLTAGANVITVRVEDSGYGGGFHGKSSGMYYEVGDEQKSLSTAWKYKIGKAILSTAQQHHHTPMLLYNKMIHPILNYPIKGALWYQGESNTGKEDAIAYRQLFPAMIKDWRSRWNCGDFPFLFVQLANFGAKQTAPEESGWAVLRESQSQTLDLVNTGQAVIIDIGEAEDIHPQNKQDVGYRLALAARHFAHGEKLIYSGPVYQSMKIEGNKIRLHFSDRGSGLLAKNKELQGFAIAGKDQKYVWAKAEIDGETVLVWSDAVSNPVSVRYAWEDNPETANLYNKEGLPASPFRTDE